MPKDEHLHALCRTRDDYRKLWDERASKPAREPAAPQPKPKLGPGMHLKGIFLELGFQSCQICGERANQMDAWGTAGCREHFEEIVAWLRESAAKLNWAQRFELVGRTAASGWLLKVSWLDPIPSFLEEAIRRAERGAAAG